MSDVNGSESRRAPGTRDKSREAKSSARRVAAPRSKSNDVGRALRSVYDTTLGEQVPDDFLDLLGKLS